MTGGLATLLRDAVSDGDGGDPPRLGADDVGLGTFAVKRRIVEDELGELSRLSGSGRGENDDDRVGGDLGEDEGGMGGDGKGSALLAELGDGRFGGRLVRLETTEEVRRLVGEVLSALLGALGEDGGVDLLDGLLGSVRVLNGRKVDAATGSEETLPLLLGLLVLPPDHLLRPDVELALRRLVHRLPQLVLDLLRDGKLDVRRRLALRDEVVLLPSDPPLPQTPVAGLEIERRVEVGAVGRVLLGAGVSDTDLRTGDGEGSPPRGLTTGASGDRVVGEVGAGEAELVACLSERSRVSREAGGGSRDAGEKRTVVIHKLPRLLKPDPLALTKLNSPAIVRLLLTLLLLHHRHRRRHSISVPTRPGRSRRTGIVEEGGAAGVGLGGRGGSAVGGGGGGGEVRGVAGGVGRHRCLRGGVERGMLADGTSGEVRLQRQKG